MPCGLKRQRWKHSKERTRKKRRRKPGRSKFDVMRAERKAGFTLTLFLIFLFAPAVSGYNFTYHIADDLSGAHTTASPSVYWPGSCTATTMLYGMLNSTTTPFSAYSFWYSPDSILTLYSPATFYNVTCRNLGTGAASSSLSGMYESKTNTTTSANARLWTIVDYICEPDANEIFLYDSIIKRTDRHGNNPFSYGKEIEENCDVTAGYTAVSEPIQYVQDWIIKGYYSGNCGGVLNVSRMYDSGVTCASGGVPKTYEVLRAEAIPFNSGASGYVNFTLANITMIRGDGTCTGGSTPAVWIFIWDTVLNTTTFIGQSALPNSFQWNLIPNRNYWLLMNQTLGGNVNFGGGTCYIRYNYTSFNLSVWAYEPDWNCSAWSECKDNIRQRSCEDLNGRVIPYIETEECSPVTSIEFLNNLGFESSYSGDAHLCSPGSWCIMTAWNISVDYPVNWTVSVNKDNSSIAYENFLTMTSEGGSREGSRALKMWYIPPKPYEPIDDGSDGASCGNITSGRFPEVNTPYNNTLFVAANISFPAENMDIRYSIKKCAKAPLQWDLPFSLCPFFSGGTIPYIMRYGPVNDTTTYGKYGIRLMDTSDNNLILDIYGEASENWEDYIADLRGLETNHNYTLAIAVNPSNEQDPYSSCVYVDKIQAVVRSEGASLESCESYCDENLTRYEAISTNPCVYRSGPSPLCVADAEDAAGLEDVISGDESYICIGNDAYSYNNLTGQLVKTANAPLCVAENEEAAAPTTTADYIALLVSPGFIAALLIMVLMVAIGIYAGGETWPLIPLGVDQFVAVCSFIGLLPAYIWIINVVAGVAFIMYFITRVGK